MPNFDPLRVLAELNALGVRYVLGGELAAAAPRIPASADRTELHVADDDGNLDRIRRFLEAVGAEPIEGTGDDHHAAFLTDAGRVDCFETPAFRTLSEGALRVDFGHGVIVSSVPGRGTAEGPTDAGELIDALREASMHAADPVPGPSRQEDDGSAEEPLEDGVRVTTARRVWKLLEEIDTFMNALDARPLRKHRGRRG